MRNIVGIRKRNSLAFVTRVFEAYRENAVVALLEDDIELPELTGFEPCGVSTPEPGTGWYRESLAQGDELQPAQIVYTSGTQGRPKAMLVSERALSDVVSRLNTAMNVDASIREYVGVPVTYSFGLGRCRAVATAGGEFFIPGRGFDPIEIRRMLETGDVNAISAVPTLFRSILQEPSVLGSFGARVKWIEIGSQYMSRAEKEQLKALFPNASILQHYGLTEASRSTFLLVSETRGDALESVGRPFGRVEVQTSPEGRIRIRGPHVAMGRITDGNIVPVVDADGWLTTDDNGHFRDGNLYFDGRADDLINSGGMKVDPGSLEQDVWRALGVKGGLAIARIQDPTRGDGFFVGVEEGQGLTVDDVREAVEAALLRRDINAGSSVKVQPVPAIPTTATGKAQRRRLAELYRPESGPGRISTSAGVLGLFEVMFERSDIGPEDSFRGLGGDSLNYVQMSIALERELGVLPSDWEKRSIAELQSVRPLARGFLSDLETNILLRAIAILAVVATHAGIFWLGGGTLLLFLLIGYNLARFKFDALSHGKILGPLLDYTKVLLVPYFIMSAVYMVYKREFSPDILLLYTNVTRLNPSLLFPFWFVQVLVQCLFITGLLFAPRSMRRSARRNPWAFAFVMALVFAGIRFAAPYLWDTTHLLDLVPQRFMAILWLGCCCYFANTTVRRFMALILGVGFAFLDLGWGVGRVAWIAGGTTAVLFIPKIRVPELMRRAVQVVASATFYIFVLNGVFIYALGRILGYDSVLAVFSLGLFGSLAGWWVIEEWGKRVLATLRLRRS